MYGFRRILASSFGVGLRRNWGRSNESARTYPANRPPSASVGVGPAQSIRPTPKIAETYPDKGRPTPQKRRPTPNDRKYASYFAFYFASYYHCSKRAHRQQQKESRVMGAIRSRHQTDIYRFLSVLPQNIGDFVAGETEAAGKLRDGGSRRAVDVGDDARLLGAGEFGNGPSEPAVADG